MTRLFFLSATCCVQITHAFVISSIPNPLPSSQCSGVYKEFRVYLWASFQPRNQFYSDSFVQLQGNTGATMQDNSKTSRISIYKPSLVNCGNINNWFQPSAVVPQNRSNPAMSTVEAIAKGPHDLCTLTNIPPSRNTIISQFVFQNAFRRVATWLWSSTSWDVGVTPPTPADENLPNSTNYTIRPDYILSTTVEYERPVCVLYRGAWCGDGVVDNGRNGTPNGNEQCDGGAQNGATGSLCSATCQNILCGNGRVDLGEQCDLGAQNGATGSTCSATCRSVSACGNGIVETWEQCDHGNKNGTTGDSCSTSCTNVVTPGGSTGGGGGGSYCNLPSVSGKSGIYFSMTGSSRPGYLEVFFWPVYAADKTTFLSGAIVFSNAYNTGAIHSAPIPLSSFLSGATYPHYPVFGGSASSDPASNTGHITIEVPNTGTGDISIVYDRSYGQNCSSSIGWGSPQARCLLDVIHKPKITVTNYSASGYADVTFEPVCFQNINDLLEGSLVFSGAYASWITLQNGTFLTGGTFPLSITIKDFRASHNPLIYPGSAGLDVARDIGSMRVYLPSNGTGEILLDFADKYGLNCNPPPLGWCATCWWGGGGYCGNNKKELGEDCDGTDTEAWKICWSNCRFITTSPTCWNGTIDNPLEDCDGIDTATGKTCDNTTCKFVFNTMPRTENGDIYIQIPSFTAPAYNGKLSDYRVIVGDGVAVFRPNDTLFFRVEDASTQSYYFNQVQTCVGTDQSIILWPNTCGQSLSLPLKTSCFCKTITGGVWNGYATNEKTLFTWNTLNSFIGKTSSFDINEIYRDSTDSTFAINLGYLVRKIPTRVSRPAITGIAGGNAYLSGSAGYDINYIAGQENFLPALAKGNFTASVLRTTNLAFGKELSSAIRPSPTQVNQQSPMQVLWIANTRTILQLSKTNFSIPTNYTNLSSLPKLGDNENIRVIANGNLTIDTPLFLSGVRTVILEKGDLIIDSDISYANPESSYGFVVKEGNIIIKNSVTQIAGAFVALDGTIQSNGVSTINRLIINGSIYGNMENLVQHRTYLYGHSGFTALDTGIILRYSSRVFELIPPLLSEFISAFQVQKTAQ